MESKELKFYKLFVELGSEIKKKFSSIPEQLGFEVSMRDIQIVEYVGKELKTMSEIANVLNLNPSTATPIIDNLVDKNILKRERNENIDRRKVFISLDQKGLILYKRMIKVQKIAVISMLEDISEVEAEKAIKIMYKMLNGLKKEDQI